MVSASNFTSVDKGTFSQPATGFLPPRAIIPLESFDGELLETLVKAGDSISEGQVLAKSRTTIIRSSIPGKILEISNRMTSDGTEKLCATISLHGSFSYIGKQKIRSDWKNYDSNTLSFLLKDAGILNTIYKREPVFTQIKRILDKKDKILVIRMFDDDPSCMTETFLSEYFFEQVVEGAAVVAKAADIRTVIFAISSTGSLTKDCKEKITPFFPGDTRIEVVTSDTKKYPCGTMHNLVSAVKKQIKEDAFKKLGKNDFFIDSRTLLHCYDCAVFGTPAIDTYVHVTGECLNGAAILKLKNGTPLKDLVDFCGGAKRKIARIIINGIVLGNAVTDLEIPISQTVRSVEFVPEKQIKAQHTETCVRCGNCRKICPLKLWPGNLYRLSTLTDRENSILNSKEIIESSILCTDCGLCNAVCPSRLPLAQTISKIKGHQI